MKSKMLLVIAAAIIVAAAAGSTMFLMQNQGHPYSTPPVLYRCSLAVLNPQVTEVAGYNGFFNNVSQGLKLQINMTFTSLTDQPLTIPIENLKVTYYNSNVNLHSWVNDNGDYSLLQQEAFNYSFSPTQVVVQPEMSNSTLLTMDVAPNAPTGQYSIEINNGNIGLEIVVTQKTDLSNINNGGSIVGPKTLQLNSNSSEMSVVRGSSTQGTILIDVLKDDPLRIFVDDAMVNATESTVPKGVLITLNTNGQDVAIPSSSSMPERPAAADLVSTSLGQNTIGFTVAASKDVPVGAYRGAFCDPELAERWNEIGIWSGVRPDIEHSMTTKVF